MASAPLELRLGRFRCGDAAQVAELPEQQFFGAATVPVMVFGAAEAKDVLDDDVLRANLDVPVAGRAAVELAGDTADQPGLVALFGDAPQAPAFIRKAGKVGQAGLPPREPGEPRGHRHVGDSGEAKTELGAWAADSGGLGPNYVGGDLGASQPSQRPPVALIAAAGGDRMGGGEGEPDWRRAAKKMFGIRRGMLVTEHLHRRRRSEKRAAPEREVEADHEAILEVKRLFKGHRVVNPTKLRKGK